MAIIDMSKIKSTSEVSLKLTSRINVGRRGARRAFDFGHSPQDPLPPPPQPGKSYPQANKDP